MRERSSRYVRIAAPLMAFLPSNWISMNFPKRDELSLRTVFAFPNASSRGLDSKTFCSTGRAAPSAEPETRSSTFSFAASPSPARPPMCAR